MKKKHKLLTQNSIPSTAQIATRDFPASAFVCYGCHLLLNFSQCQVDLNNLEQIKHDLMVAVDAVGATIVAHLSHRFTPQGVSVILMLSESHASVHTYPEHGSCFLDIFTCGSNLQVEKFGEVLQRLWLPQRVSRQLIERFEPIESPL